MFKFLLNILFGNKPEQMPLEMFNDFKLNNPKLKTRDEMADYMVFELGSTYGEAYSALPQKYFV